MTTPNLPRHVHCVMVGYDKDATDPPMDVEKHMTWCGRRPVLGFCFVDPTHAILNARQQGRMQICPACSAAIAKTLADGTYPG